MITMDELTVAKIAFQAGYENVFYDEDGEKGTLATPDNWLVDTCYVKDFAYDTGIVVEETDNGDVYRFETAEDKEAFLSLYAKEVAGAEKSENELLQDFRQQENG